MTSKHLFLKAMAEEMRHRLWMLSLSVLGHFLILFVPFLIVRSNLDNYVYPKEAETIVIYMAAFVKGYVTVAGGILAILGAMITGIFGFRYAFRKRHVDTWHSLPVKRRTLYGVCWLDGFLIWFVPMLLSVLFTGGMAGVTAYDLMGAGGAFAVAKETGIVICVLTVTFLLVYHLVLVAVMISGNMLNAITCMLLLGTGVICIYGLGLGFAVLYLDTFYEAGEAIPAAYASPLVGSIYLLARAADRPWESMLGVINCLVHQILIAAALGGCAFFLYQRRPSELAEQGVRNKGLSALMRILAGAIAGMGGWLLFVLLVDDYQAVGWGIFGAVLFAVLAMGVLDMIFSMEFKAFLAHWAQMTGIVVAVLLLDVAFCFDWLGYDTYLPDQEDIAQIAIYDPDLCNRTDRHEYSRIEESLRRMQYEDAQTAYAFLERMTDRYMPGAKPVQGNRDKITVRVTLKNGRSYYRDYQATSADSQVLAPLICSEAYLEQNYLFDIEDMEEEELLGKLILVKGQRSGMVEKEREVMHDILEAYNNDCLEHPEILIGEGGRILLEMNLPYPDGGYRYNCPVYEGMSHTIEALDAAGLGEWTADLDPADVEEIELPLGYYPPDTSWTKEELVTLARQVYGVALAQEKPSGTGTKEAEAQERMELSKEEEELCLTVTDPAAIRTLLGLVSYESGRSNVFWRNGIRLRLEGKDGKGCSVYLQKGSLPEELVLRFGELAGQ